MGIFVLHLTALHFNQNINDVNEHRLLKHFPHVQLNTEMFHPDF